MKRLRFTGLHRPERVAVDGRALALDGDNTLDVPDRCVDEMVGTGEYVTVDLGPIEQARLDIDASLSAVLNAIPYSAELRSKLQEALAPFLEPPAPVAVAGPPVIIPQPPAAPEEPEEPEEPSEPPLFSVPAVDLDEPKPDPEPDEQDKPEPEAPEEFGPDAPMDQEAPEPAVTSERLAEAFELKQERKRNLQARSDERGIGYGADNKATLVAKLLGLPQDWETLA